ncbi:MAG: aminoacetone oxidase family FAD-binding enzyme [Candidatus Sumerlaeia bacterium]|nr:aminoacetone oxidase family FAD-binding enzyme [Candidatus Sumerlaeia bacterium]
MQADLVIVGAGAAGLAAAIFAGEAAQGAGLRIVLLDSAKRPGAKILVSGGGRCNVTHQTVTEDDYWGGPRPLIRRVLRTFDESHTVAWMESLGVALKLESTGKYFPVSDRAETVLEALLARVAQAGVRLIPGARVEEINRGDEGFRVQTGSLGTLSARRLIVATGGLSLPKSGSDGLGLHWMRCLGHTVVPATPALVPLVLLPGPSPGGRFRELSGLVIEGRLRLRVHPGGLRHEAAGPILFTHFGLSGPAVLDFSRHLLRSRLTCPADTVTLGQPRWRQTSEADAWLLAQAKAQPRALPATVLGEVLPARWARLLAEGLPAMSQLRRDQREELAQRLTELPLQVTGSRGYSYAETTAGGVDLREVSMRTMESRRVPGLHLCGEILDVDGRIGGFNFQWAWASGHVAGRAAAAALL